MASYFAPGQMLGGCQQEFTDLSAACTAGSSACPSGKCIMAATVDGTDWSDCSRAYYSMYNCLTGVMPTYYNDACVNAGVIACVIVCFSTNDILPNKLQSVP